jgi:hypothetical protein
MSVKKKSKSRQRRWAWHATQNKSEDGVFRIFIFLFAGNNTFNTYEKFGG